MDDHIENTATSNIATDMNTLFLGNGNGGDGEMSAPIPGQSSRFVRDCQNDTSSKANPRRLKKLYGFACLNTRAISPFSNPLPEFRSLKTVFDR
jgi:hypothetical protein